MSLREAFSVTRTRRSFPILYLISPFGAAGVDTAQIYADFAASPTRVGFARGRSPRESGCFEAGGKMEPANLSNLLK